MEKWRKYEDKIFKTCRAYLPSVVGFWRTVRYSEILTFLCLEYLWCRKNGDNHFFGAINRPKRRIVWGIGDSKQSRAGSTRVDGQMCVLPARRMKPSVVPRTNVSLLTLSYAIEQNEPYKVRQCFYNNEITDFLQRQQIYKFIWGRTALFNPYSTVFKGPTTFAKDYKSQWRPNKGGEQQKMSTELKK